MFDSNRRSRDSGASTTLKKNIITTPAKAYNIARTSFNEDRQRQPLARDTLLQHAHLRLDLDISMKVIRARRDHMMDEVCDFFYKFIERLDAENGEGERGEIGATATTAAAAAGVILGAVGWLLGGLATSSAFERWWGRRSDGR